MTHFHGMMLLHICVEAHYIKSQLSNPVEPCTIKTISYFNTCLCIRILSLNATASLWCSRKMNTCCFQWPAVTL